MTSTTAPRPDAPGDGDPRGAVILLSGGLDSTTALALARAEHPGRPLYALSFRYGQRHALELACAARQAARFAVQQHEIIDLEHLGRLTRGASALLEGSPLDVPMGRDVEAAGDIPVTYVPARNTLFLAYALAWAEALELRELWIGVNAVDYSGYPDCRPEFIRAFEQTANLATRLGVTGQRIRVRTPLISWTKGQIIQAGLERDVDYGDTVSCYAPTEDDRGPLACGRCDSCQLRRAGFAEAGAPDPTRYAAAPGL
ncbi:MAG: 7-cyano-7-deazaguanine synthase QueC [Myxococcales bacterium]|nr:7-cyano-7-deazaguanine synthase QueC [Myxococcales bacterium]